MVTFLVRYWPDDFGSPSTTVHFATKKMAVEHAAYLAKACGCPYAVYECKVIKSDGGKNARG